MFGEKLNMGKLKTLHEQFFAQKRLNIFIQRDYSNASNSKICKAYVSTKPYFFDVVDDTLESP